MTYLVMECHYGYAIVLDTQGRYLKVANRNYLVGQQVTDVIPFEIPKKQTNTRRWANIGALAACLCVVVSLWLVMLLPFGTVRLQINPDVLLTVNRLNFVIDAEGLNEDGKALLQGFDYKRMKLPQVSDSLADRATAEGYLTEDGAILVTVTCRNERWRAETEDALVTELRHHMNDTVTVSQDANDIPQWRDDDHDDDDWDDDHDDDDDDDDWDDFWDD